eukprot:scaffold21597_cov56-Phaeocystis_antarctica.AAC.3
MVVPQGGDSASSLRWHWAERVARTSTAPPEGCTHIDEVLSAAPPDVEVHPAGAFCALPRWRMPQRRWKRGLVSLEPY